MSGTVDMCACVCVCASVCACVCVCLKGGRDVPLRRKAEEIAHGVVVKITSLTTYLLDAGRHPHQHTHFLFLTLFFTQKQTHVHTHTHARTPSHTPLHTHSHTYSSKHPWALSQDPQQLRLSLQPDCFSPRSDPFHYLTSFPERGQSGQHMTTQHDIRTQG